MTENLPDDIYVFSLFFFFLTGKKDTNAINEEIGNLDLILPFKALLLLKDENSVGLLQSIGIL